MIQKIVIDPGHGGYDNGAVWGYEEEDDINLIVAFLLRCELEKTIIDVELTRERDEAVSLASRVIKANIAKADYFISVHCDAFHNTTAEGMTTHIFTHANPETEIIANGIQRSLIERFPDHRNRGVRRSNFYVLRKTQMPAVLVECEFLSNPKTRRFLREPEYQLGLAQAIAKGIN